MPVKLQDKMAETKTITVMWGEDEVLVSYHPNAVTPDLLDRVDGAAKEENLSVLGVLLDPVLDWWDVLDNSGKRIPTDKITIATIPMPFLNKVQVAIQEDQNPPE